VAHKFAFVQSCTSILFILCKVKRLTSPRNRSAHVHDAKPKHKTHRQEFIDANPSIRLPPHKYPC
jgi:hypothetical protein